MMTLLCLQDNYTHEGRALVEDLKNAALSDAAQNERGQLMRLGQTFKQLNAPVGVFGRDAIRVSTTAIKGDAATYTSLENQLQDLVGRRDALASSIEARLEAAQRCGSADADRGALEQLNRSGQAFIEDMRRLARSPDDDDEDAAD
jgi:hypothetical protein